MAGEGGVSVGIAIHFHGDNTAEVIKVFHRNDSDITFG